MSKRLTSMLLLTMALGLMVCPASAGLKDGLVGRWMLDEGEGAIATDASGNANDGTFMGAPEWVEGREGIGNALFFSKDIANSLVTIPSNDSLEGTEGITIALWTKPEEAQTNWSKFICRLRTNNGNDPYPFQIGFDNQGQINTTVWASATVAAEPKLANFPGEWGHLAMTYDGSALLLYKNGEQVAQGAGSGALQQNNLDIRFGGRGVYNQNLNGTLDDILLYDRALSAAEVAQSMNFGIDTSIAAGAKPTSGASNLPSDLLLSWVPGEGSVTADVYFGMDLDSVTNASQANPMGVLLEPALNATSLAVDNLAYGATYYWRVDGIEADGTTLHKGDVWSFTVESELKTIPAAAITAVASSHSDADSLAENVINGSGLEDGLHTSNPIGTMWLADLAGPQPTSIEFTFDMAYQISEMLVWNHNSSFGIFGIKEATVEYSADGVTFESLGVQTFTKANGEPDYAADTQIDFGGVSAQVVRITVQSTHGGVPGGGLSEVQFGYLPLSAYNLSPADGGVDQDVALSLSWWTGRQAASHELFISTDEQAVIDETVSAVVIPVDGSIVDYALDDLALGQTYAWKVVEVGADGTRWPSNVMSFSTVAARMIDDMEAYRPEDGKEIWQTWGDGFDDNDNGMLVGNGFAGDPETDNKRSGKQSMPLHYDNTAAEVSEAKADVAKLMAGTNWNTNGVITLTLYFYGDPQNTLQQMYVKLNDIKVPYDGDGSIQQATWQAWNIELAAVAGLNTAEVTEMIIGMEKLNGAGGLGVVLVDDIQLTAREREFITPVAPSTDGLVAHLKLDESEGTVAANAVVGGAAGTVMNDVTWMPNDGKVDGAIQFPANSDSVSYVDLPTNGMSLEAGTISLWVNVDEIQPAGNSMFFGHVNQNAWANRIYMLMPADSFSLRLGLGNSSNRHDKITTMATAAWTHLLLTWDNGSYNVYINGKSAAQGNYAGLDALQPALHIGANGRGLQGFAGMADDVLVYSRALSMAEAAWAAGLREPIEK